MQIRDVMQPASVCGARHTLQQAMGPLQLGHPVFMKRDDEWRVLRPQGAVGYPLSRRLIDIPMQTITALHPDQSLEAVASEASLWDLASVQDGDQLLGYVSHRHFLDAWSSGDTLVESLKARLLDPLLHDLANSLLVAAASIELMSAPVAEVGAELNAARLALSHTSRMVSRIREVSAGHEDACPDCFTLDSLLLDLEPLLRVCAHPLHLELQLGAGDLQVRMHRRSLERTLLNLLLNARESLGGRGNVRFDTSLLVTDGKEWGRLRVEDDGPGISPNLAKGLFEPHTSGRGVGRGVGLFAVRQALARSGARIAVCPTEAGGAGFELALPVA